MNTQTENKVKELQAQGIPVFSFSRLETFRNCKLEYRMSYVDEDRKENEDNVYSFFGGVIHDALERIHNNETIDMDKIFDEALILSREKGLEFPKKGIEHNYITSLKHFIANYKRVDMKSINELLFLINIKGAWIRGYIDKIIKDPLDKDSFMIIDYKTSSMYSKAKRQEYGRQLILYGVALEELYGIKVSRIAWDMLKYVRISSVNNSFRSKNVSRHEIASEMRRNFYKLLEKKGYYMDQIADILEEAINTNTIPEVLKDEIIVENCLVEHEYSEESKEELKAHIYNLVEEIKNEEKYPPVKIDGGSAFKCQVLCNHRRECPALRKYLTKLKENYIIDEKPIDVDKIFG